MSTFLKYLVSNLKHQKGEKKVECLKDTRGVVSSTVSQKNLNLGEGFEVTYPVDLAT